MWGRKGFASLYTLPSFQTSPANFYRKTWGKSNLDMKGKSAQKWWKDAVVYQIWPASFCDSNDDGVGDLLGIIQKLDHLRDLGVDLIWLSPIYDSPQHDMGYDVRNYEDVWAKYGTMEDMDRLISEAKSRGIRIVMDLVINHTSNEHKWFLESRESKTNPYSDWYIWRDPKYDADGTRRPPSNWRAAFGGSAWEYVAERDQYYLHLCLPQQPDLNWLNPATRKAIFSSAVDFWLRKGIDGFRIDVVNFYWKDPTFPDAAVILPDEEFQPMEGKHIINGPPVHDWLKELRSKITENHGDEIVLIGELPGTDPAEILRYTSPEAGQLDMIFDFDIFMAGNDWSGLLHTLKLPSLRLVKDSLIKTQTVKDAWTTAFLENHDNSRSVSRFGPGDGPQCEAAAKMLAVFVCTLSGTLFIYQGQEIGMTNIPNHWTRKDLRDAAVLRYLDKVDRDHPGDEGMGEKALAAARKFGRDNARTPVQWTNEKHAGFSRADPWIRVNENYRAINVADQVRRTDSVLSFWKRMIAIRRQFSKPLVYGDFEVLDKDNAETMCYLKSYGQENMLVTLNFSGEKAKMCLPSLAKGDSWKLVASSIGNGVVSDTLQPWEGRLYARH